MSTEKTISKTGVEEIKFGTGGGFTGVNTTYKLTSNAKLYKNNKALKEINLEKTSTFFKKAKSLKGYTYKKPGNIYSFIEIKTADHSNKIVWGSTQSQVKAEVIEFFKNLQLITK